VRQVCYLQELYRDAGSTERKTFFRNHKIQSVDAVLKSSVVLSCVLWVDRKLFEGETSWYV